MDRIVPEATSTAPTTSAAFRFPVKNIPGKQYCNMNPKTSVVLEIRLVATGVRSCDAAANDKEQTVIPIQCPMRNIAWVTFIIYTGSSKYTMSAMDATDPPAPRQKDMVIGEMSCSLDRMVQMLAVTITPAITVKIQPMVDSIPVRNAIVFLSSQGKGSAAVVKFTSLIPIHNPLFKCSNGGSDWQMRTPPINTMIISGQSTGRTLSFRMNVDTNADETMELA